LVLEVYEQVKELINFYQHEKFRAPIDLVNHVTEIVNHVIPLLSDKIYYIRQTLSQDRHIGRWFDGSNESDKWISDTFRRVKQFEVPDLINKYDWTDEKQNIENMIQDRRRIIYGIKQDILQFENERLKDLERKSNDLHSIMLNHQPSSNSPDPASPIATSATTTTTSSVSSNNSSIIIQNSQEDLLVIELMEKQLKSLKEKLTKLKKFIDNILLQTNVESFLMIIDILENLQNLRNEITQIRKSIIEHNDANMQLPHKTESSENSNDNNNNNTPTMNTTTTTTKKTNTTSPEVIGQINKSEKTFADIKDLMILHQNNLQMIREGKSANAIRDKLDIIKGKMRCQGTKTDASIQELDAHMADSLKRLNNFESDYQHLIAWIKEIKIWFKEAEYDFDKLELEVEKFDAEGMTGLRACVKSIMCANTSSNPSTNTNSSNGSSNRNNNTNSQINEAISNDLTALALRVDWECRWEQPIGIRDDDGWFINANQPNQKDVLIELESINQHVISFENDNLGVILEKKSSTQTNTSSNPSTNTNSSNGSSNRNNNTNSQINEAISNDLTALALRVDWECRWEQPIGIRDDDGWFINANQPNQKDVLIELESINQHVISFENDNKFFAATLRNFRVYSSGLIEKKFIIRVEEFNKHIEQAWSNIGEKVIYPDHSDHDQNENHLVKKGVYAYHRKMEGLKFKVNKAMKDYQDALRLLEKELQQKSDDLFNDTFNQNKRPILMSMSELRI
ncbi:11053_t:CDS:10, partial [Entrophospora sp. SA101]